MNQFPGFEYLGNFALGAYCRSKEGRMVRPNVLDAPSFCQYESGKCSRIRAKLELQDAFFAYPSKPEIISSQIVSAIKDIQDLNICTIQDWQDLAIQGRIIYCEICKAIRRSTVLVADITTLNDNVLFELGFAVGLGKRIWPIRDVTYKRDDQRLKKIGLFDYTGYTDFRNSKDIVNRFITDRPWAADDSDSNPFYRDPGLTDSSRLVHLKSNHSSDGSVELTSVVKKSRIPTQVIDPRENLQFSLRDYAGFVANSLGTLVHMVDPLREDSETHNAKCAFVAGMALAMEKPVLIVQEGEIVRPIDFGEIIRTYSNAKNIRLIVDHWIGNVRRNRFKADQISRGSRKKSREVLESLESLYLGELAAENEIDELNRYFVETPLYRSLVNMRGATVVGRKGTGKTALFYQIRHIYQKRPTHVVLDLKPEGHQLKLFGGVILDGFPGATKLYLIKSFWEYVILSELGRRILRDKSAYHQPETFALVTEIERTLNPLELAWDGDFAQRLLELVNALHRNLADVPRDRKPGEITQHLYKDDMPKLLESVGKYLAEKKDTIILIDNLDKDWKPFEDLTIEVDILRALLDSLRTLENGFGRMGVSFRAFVFVRNDVFKLLHRRTPDKGKDNVVNLQWDDKQALREVLQERLEASSGSSEITWDDYFTESVKGVDSFSYLVDRTLMRPRDLLTFCRMSVDTAIGRKHERVEEDDILHAEKTYSMRMLSSITDEIRDVFGDIEGCLLEFVDEDIPIPEERILRIIAKELPDRLASEVLEILVEYGFLGVETAVSEYSYSVDGPDSMAAAKRRAEKYAQQAGRPKRYVVHPTFRAGLGIKERWDVTSS